MERRLAAILAADVVGYSRLMGDDEEGTLARLKVYRKEIIDAGVGGFPVSQPSVKLIAGARSGPQLWCRTSIQIDGLTMRVELNHILTL